MSLGIFRELLQQSNAKGSRSTILQPLIAVVAVIICAIGLLAKVGVPIWFIAALGVFLFLFLVLIMVAYTYCLFNDRDAIRSEKYSIEKMAIEKGFYGDSAKGVFKDKNFQLIKFR